ncbi:hypothetical protein E1287_36695, partial [Actinomadura sp. KC06]|uniref:hypothetical protein n=1 Tax=Actinomadura sp. KC06 TaxID=2530369 RepID=UPI00104EA2DD
MGEPGDRRLNWMMGPGSLHLAALDAVVAGSDSLACGLVSRGGGPLVLNVVSRADKSRWLDVGCERVGGVWWCVDTVTGEGVVPVVEVERAPGVLVGLL